jgi:diaminopimelate epimerase
MEDRMRFAKMHGLGNDFLIFEDDGSGRDWNAIAADVCRRRLSVGGDGIMVVLPSDIADIRMRIINADGSEAEMCGNGIRCFAKYVYEHGIVKKSDMTVETLAGIIRPKLCLDGETVSGVSVDMGMPSFERADIPMGGEGLPVDVDITAAGENLTITTLLMGVPHTVVQVEALDATDMMRLGPAIETHALFPRKTNVNFVQVIDRQNIRMQTWERGAGLTMACGTGACASVVALSRKGLIETAATVRLAAGELHIAVKDDGRVIMTGPAAHVCDATLIS